MMLFIYHCNNCIINRRFVNNFKDHFKKFSALYHNSDIGNVQKDVMLYRRTDALHLKLINFFAFSQFVFWNYISYFAFSTMKSYPKSELTNLTWWQQVDFGKYRKPLTIAGFMIGWGTLGFAWIYTLHSVKLLILNRGGKYLTFTTYTPLIFKRTFKIPVEQVSAKQSRISAVTHLPLKIRGRFFYYLLDTSGEFTNTKIFDYYAGLKRSWVK